VLNFFWLPYTADVRIRQKYCAIATRLLLCMLWLQVHELIKLNINPSSNAETIEIWHWTVSVVYVTTANVAGVAIWNFRVGPSLSNRNESGRLILIWIECGSFAGPYQKTTYVACEALFLAVTRTSRSPPRTTLLMLYALIATCCDLTSPMRHFTSVFYILIYITGVWCGVSSLT